MILKEGDTGSLVVKLQKLLGVDADGVFGPKTKAAVIAFQHAHGLAEDGIVGPATAAAYSGGEVPPVVSPGNPSPIDGDNSSYRQLFDSMSLRSSHLSEINHAADKVLLGRSRYEAVEAKTGVPWYMIGCIHLLEGDCNFNTHLHNGDSLAHRTVHVPAGRPKAGNPPFSWEESALDALAYDGIKPPLNTIGQQFYACERFNGLGYRSHGVNTPYLWSYSNHYTSGRYVADGVWSSSSVSQQVGIACVYKIFKDRGIIIL